MINKKLMAGREHMVRHEALQMPHWTKLSLMPFLPVAQVRNEIAVLKRVSAGHPNICRLVDHFETAHNLYLVFDLCTGGELFDRICSKGNYYERCVGSGLGGVVVLIKGPVGMRRRSCARLQVRLSTCTIKGSFIEVSLPMRIPCDCIVLKTPLFK